MLMRLQKYSAPLICFAVLSDAFTNDEIEKIIFLEKLLAFNKGKVGNPNVEVSEEGPKEVRDSDVSFLLPDENSSWLFDRLANIIPMVNYDHFMFDIEGIEAVQYTRYGIDQHYNWHVDAGFGWTDYVRKISLTIMLDDPEDYEGGELEVCNNGDFNNIAVLKPKKGDIVFFASWMPHRVRPVTLGTRRSIVSWILGKK